MRTRPFRAAGRAVILPALLALSACTVPYGTDPQTGFIRELPEEIVSIAAPGQDLAAVQLNPDDGCYWYRYEGPVETTMLPLRSREGRPICTQPATA